MSNKAFYVELCLIPFKAIAVATAITVVYTYVLRPLFI